MYTVFSSGNFFHVSTLLQNSIKSQWSVGNDQIAKDGWTDNGRETDILIHGRHVVTVTANCLFKLIRFHHLAESSLLVPSYAKGTCLTPIVAALLSFPRLCQCRWPQTRHTYLPTYLGTLGAAHTPRRESKECG